MWGEKTGEMPVNPQALRSFPSLAVAPQTSSPATAAPPWYSVVGAQTSRVLRGFPVACSTPDGQMETDSPPTKLGALQAMLTTCRPWEAK